MSDSAAAPTSAPSDSGKSGNSARLVTFCLLGIVAVGFLAYFVGGRAASEAEREAEAAKNEVATLRRETDRLRLLKVEQSLNELEERAALLWPARPELRGEYLAWIEEAEALAKDLEKLREERKRLRRRSRPLAPGDAAPERSALALEREETERLVRHAEVLRMRLRAADLAEADRGYLESAASDLDGRLNRQRLRTARLERWRFDSREDRWLHVRLDGLIQRLESFLDPQVGLVRGDSPRWGAGMKRRLRVAENIEGDTLGDYAARWTAAAERVAASDRYQGLALRPQIGLIPLGPDPKSGLEEFAHLESGAVPERRLGNRLDLAENTGVVFVLLPGTQGQGAGAPALEPFFCAKHETTQGQWMTVTGNNPSRYRPKQIDPRANPEGIEFTLRHPVESVPPASAAEFARRLGLDLPTEAQWDFAAYGGVVSNPTDLKIRSTESANLASPSTEGGTPSSEPEDLFSYHAPVGSLAANGYGLHDIFGNVFEPCRDAFARVTAPRLQETGERVGGFEGLVATRGGGFASPRLAVTLGGRNAWRADAADPALGFRLVRKLSP